MISELFCYPCLSGALQKNSADPDQTAPKEQSDLGLHCLPMHFVHLFG